MKDERTVVLTVDAITEEGLSRAVWQRTDAPNRTFEWVGGEIGDRYEARIVKQGRRWRLQAKKPLACAPPDVVPPCPVFGVCGGCRLQHWSLPRQQKWKVARLQQQFKEAAIDAPPFEPLLTAPQPWRYRNTMELSFGYEDGAVVLGLRPLGSPFRVVPLQDCYLAPTWMRGVLVGVVQWAQRENLSVYHMRRNAGLLLSLKMRYGHHTKQRMVALTVRSREAFPKALADSFVQAVQQHLDAPFDPNSDSLLLMVRHQAPGCPTTTHVHPLYGRETIFERFEYGTSSWDGPMSPDTFFQPNSYTAPKMVETLVRWVQEQTLTTGWDLCCGVGTFTHALAPYLTEILGVENNPQSLVEARACSTYPITWVEEDLVTFVKKSAAPTPSFVLVDPPRAGLGKKVIHALSARGVPRLFYISCNPKTFVCDARRLQEQGYRLVRVQPVDQFPHTPHLELLTAWEKHV